MQGSCSVTHCFTALVLRWSGGGAASHLQPHWPIRHADSVCACGCADSRHTHGAHCALSCKFCFQRLHFLNRLSKKSSLMVENISKNCAQVRRAIQQMMFPNKTFNWPRHIAIAFVLLTFINLLVIFAPNILGIFGIIGRFTRCIKKHKIDLMIQRLQTADEDHPHVTLGTENTAVWPNTQDAGAQCLPSYPVPVRAYFSLHVK